MHTVKDPAHEVVSKVFLAARKELCHSRVVSPFPLGSCLGLLVTGGRHCVAAHLAQECQCSLGKFCTSHALSAACAAMPSEHSLNLSKICRLLATY